LLVQNKNAAPVGAARFHHFKATDTHTLTPLQWLAGLKSCKSQSANVAFIDARRTEQKVMH
jgi:hypothetical protein